VTQILQAMAHALAASFGMFWEIFWPLALGFILSAVVQSLVSRQAVARTLGTDSPRSLGIACGLGAASSSCSYAAVAIARSLFVKGASLINTIVFEFASTNLVFELGLILLILLGWQFLAAEFVGGLLMSSCWPSSSAKPSARGLLTKPGGRRNAACGGGWKGTPRWTWPSPRDHS